MKSVIMTLSAGILVCGMAHGQEEPGPNQELLKSHRPVIGTWRYEGPLLESIPEFAEKGTKYVNQISWKWILDKYAVEIAWFSEFEDGKRISGKGLIGWNAAEKEITFGGMDSSGGISLGTIVMEDGDKVSTLTSEGISGNGEKTTFKGIINVTGKDTLTWHAAERTGGLVEGPSPKYSFTRVKRAARAKRSDK